TESTETATGRSRRGPDRSSRSSGTGRLRVHRPRFERERERVVGLVDRDGTAVLEPAEEDLVGQPIPHLALDDACEGAGAVDRIVPLPGEPGAGGRRERDGDPALAQLRLELQDELVDDRLH